MRRGQSRAFSLGGETVEVRFATAEDTLLRKLEWYRRGREISDRQWRDILGILRVQAAKFDGAYLERWARALSVDNLLARARAALLRPHDPTP